MLKPFILLLSGVCALAAAATGTETDLPAPGWLDDVWITAEGHNPNHYPRHGAAGFQLGQFRLMDYAAVRYRSDRGAQYMDSLASPDFTAEMTQRIHDAGMRNQGYLIPYRSELSNVHPDWWMRDWNGNPVDDHGPCLDFMSPWGDELIARIAEADAKYPLDMIWLDGFTYQWHGGAKGDYAIQRFEADTGLKMPERWDLADPVCRRWLEWRGEVLTEYLKKMQNTLRRQDPELAFAYNALRYMMWPPWQAWGYEAVERAVDLPCAEYSWYIGNDPVHKRFLFARLRGVRGSRPAFSWIVPNMDGGMQIPAPEAETMSRVYTCLTQRIGVGLLPDLLPEDDVNEIVDAVKKRIPYLRRAQDVRYVALVATERDDWFFDLTDHPFTYRHNYEGVYRMLNEAHLPVDVISEADLTPEGLAGYAVVVLPGQHCLSDRAAEAIRGFVKAGGGLVATDLTGAYDAYANKRQTPVLADLFGCRFEGADFDDPKMERRGAMAVDMQSACCDSPEFRRCLVNRTLGQGQVGTIGPDGCTRDPESKTLIDHLGLEGQPIRLRATVPDGGRPVAWLLDENWQKTLPAAYEHVYGAGKVAYFPMDLGGMYAISSYPQWRLLLTQALLAVAPEPPPIYAIAPLSVQFEPTWQPEEGRYVIHLLNDHLQSLCFLDQPRRIRQDLPPIAGIQVVVRGKRIAEAWAEPMHEALVIDYRDGDSFIHVPVLKDHLMVVFHE